MSYRLPVAAWLLMCLLLTAPGAALAEETQGDGDTEEEAPPAEVGFDLGDYFIKNFRPVEGSRTKLSFVLHAAVEGEEADAFEELLRNRTHRVRDQVIISSRLAEEADFREPDLRSFRRRILVRLRRAVPELAIKEVYFSDFRYTVE